jgi:hypothetical protein
MSEVSLRNEPQDEMARLMLGAREALTDSMVERLSVSAANALEVLDRLNDEDARAAVTNGLDRLAEMQRIGALDTLFDFVGLLHAARSASTDNIVERLFAFAEHMVNTVGSEEAATLVMDAEGALGEAAEEVCAGRPAAACWRRCRCWPSRNRSAASPSCSPSARSCWRARRGRQEPERRKGAATARVAGGRGGRSRRRFRHGG